MYIGPITDPNVLYRMASPGLGNEIVVGACGYLQRYRKPIRVSVSKFWQDLRFEIYGMPFEPERAHSGMIHLHAGSLWDDSWPPKGPEIEMCVLNALSTNARLDLYHPEQGHWWLNYNQGVPVQAPTWTKMVTAYSMGIVQFYLDPEIFPTLTFDLNKIEEKLSKYTLPGVRISVNDGSREIVIN